jgi:hypothetical protein
MWILVLLILINSVLHQQGVQNEYRLSLGIIQLGILEIAMSIGLLYALVLGGSIRGQFPSLRTHPILVWILVPMFIGAGFGILGGMIQGNLLKYILSSAREFLAIPVCVLIGYRLIGTPQRVRTMGIVTIIAGVLTATMLFWSFGEQSEVYSLKGNINYVRGIINHWHSEGAAVAALTLVFIVLMRVPLWPTTISVIIGLYCYIGYAATLSRVGFLILLFGTASCYLLLPKGERLQKFLRSLVFIPVLFFACWGALFLADRALGRNFAGKVTDHMLSLLPGERTGTNEKAWDSRIGGIQTELAIWLRNPLMGQGFGAGETAYLGGRVTSAYVAIKHNGWTATLAETGIFGFVGLFVLIVSTMLIGYRMVHDRTSPAYMLMGAAGFFTGVVFFLRCSGTMAVTSRAAIGFGIVCGALIRAREIQETHVAMAQQEAYYDPHVDEQTGLLVPEYEWELSHFGTN